MKYCQDCKHYSSMFDDEDGPTCDVVRDVVGFLVPCYAARDDLQNKYLKGLETKDWCGSEARHFTPKRKENKLFSYSGNIQR